MAAPRRAPAPPRTPDPAAPGPGLRNQPSWRRPPPAEGPPRAVPRPPPPRRTQPLQGQGYGISPRGAARHHLKSLAHEVVEPVRWTGSECRREGDHDLPYERVLCEWADGAEQHG